MRILDKEEIIKGLQIEHECVSRDCDRDCGKCDLVQDREWLLSVYEGALTILKEREAIIQCKNCKWYDEQISLCDNCGLPREQTFFCADGKRKEGGK